MRVRIGLSERTEEVVCHCRIEIRLTTVRVVCQNTLSIAMKERLGKGFRRAHQGSLADHAAAAQEFFSATLRELDSVAQAFTSLTQRRCADKKFGEILMALVPDPRKPRNVDRYPGLMRAWQKQCEAARTARAKITDLRSSGKGQQLKGSEGTLWGVLNAVLEYVDHHSKTDQTRLAYSLLGDGMDLKVRAYRAVQEELKKAA